MQLQPNCKCWLNSLQRWWWNPSTNGTKLSMYIIFMLFVTFRFHSYGFYPFKKSDWTDVQYTIFGLTQYQMFIKWSCLLSGKAPKHDWWSPVIVLLTQLDLSQNSAHPPTCSPSAYHIFPRLTFFSNIEYCTSHTHEWTNYFSIYSYCFLEWKLNYFILFYDVCIGHMQHILYCK